MATLNAHLRHPDHHGALPFHPACAICRRDRLLGELPVPSVISHRTVAGITAGLLALSAAAPPVTSAAEPDHEQAGSAPIHGSPGGYDKETPTFDPGGRPAVLPDSSPTAPGEPDDESAEPEPAKDAPAPVADPGDPVPEPGAQRQTGPTMAQGPADSQPPPVLNPGAGSSRPPRVGGHENLPDLRAHGHAHRPDAGTGRAHREPGAMTGAVEDEPAQIVSYDSATPTESVSRTARATTGRPAPASPRRGRTHMVVAGECLWSIARTILGPDASDAEIAREVHRLWDLNRSQIATGHPDLLPVGTKLRLA
jgi:hypothetical protein